VLEHGIVSQRSTKENKLAGHKYDETQQEFLTKHRRNPSTKDHNCNNQTMIRDNKVSVSNSIMHVLCMKITPSLEEKNSIRSGFYITS
jgi:hypothetical protein